LRGSGDVAQVLRCPLAVRHPVDQQNTGHGIEVT
jgi:hypothetical protein